MTSTSGPGLGAGSGAGLECAAAAVLTEAVRFEQQRRRLEALTCYTEGVNLLLQAIKDVRCGEEKRAKLRRRVDEYMTHAEHLKQQVERDKAARQFHQQYDIADGATGFDYDSIFGSLIDDDLHIVDVEDAYVRVHHQLQNFTRFCEVLVRRASNLRYINLYTGRDDNLQQQDLQQRAFAQLKQSLSTYNITLKVEYKKELHDREIRLNNGWVVKVGRGLDIYKRAASNYSVGAHELRLRPCHATKVDVWHRDTYAVLGS